MLHEPSDINPRGWATIARVAIGGEAPILLPADERPRPSLILQSGSQDDWAVLEINAPGTARDKETIGLKRDQPRREIIKGQNVEVWHRTIPAEAPSSSPYALVIVRQVPDGEANLPPPAAEKALELLYEVHDKGSQGNGAASSSSHGAAAN